VHAEHENAAAWIVRPHPPDHVEATQHAAPDGEIDDDHIGMVATEKPIARGHVSCLQHGLDVSVF